MGPDHPLEQLMASPAPGPGIPTRPWTVAEARAAGLREMSRRPPLGTYLRMLWARREFALLVPLGEMRQRNMDTLLGGSWHVLNPLFQAGIYYLLFGVLLQQRAGVANYPAWLIIGLFLFGLTQKSVQSSARIIVTKAGMLRSLNFPAGILPISVNLSELLAFIPAAGVMLLVVTLTGERPTLLWGLLLPLIVLQFVMNLGLSLIVARMTVHFRDLDNLLNHLLRMWMYFSGVLFPIDLAPEGWIREVLRVNPPHTFLETARSLLLDGTLDVRSASLAAAWAVVAIVVGVLFFHRYEGRYSNAA
jgi:teichoic acid transport system permease protein